MHEPMRYQRHWQKRSAPLLRRGATAMLLAAEAASTLLALTTRAQWSPLPLSPLLSRDAIGGEAHSTLPAVMPNLRKRLTEVACLHATLDAGPG